MTLNLNKIYGQWLPGNIVCCQMTSSFEKTNNIVYFKVEGSMIV